VQILSAGCFWVHLVLFAGQGQRGQYARGPANTTKMVNSKWKEEDMLLVGHDLQGLEC
jgi:hypothetical protein